MALEYISRQANRLKISSTSIFEKSGRKITRFQTKIRRVGKFNLAMRKTGAIQALKRLLVRRMQGFQQDRSFDPR